MKKFLQNRQVQRTLTAGLLAAPLLSRADATYDTSSVTTALTAVAAAVAVIGAAVLVVKVGVKAWKMIGAAM